MIVAILLGLFFRVPASSDSLEGVRMTRESLKQSLGNKEIWFFGFAFLGAYGAFLTASQLISGYGEARGIDPLHIALAAFFVGIAGVPGSIIGGLIADRFLSPKSLFMMGAMLEGVFLLLLPIAPPAFFWPLAFGVGFMFALTLAVWQTVPGSSPRIAPENIGTAIGLMLSVSAIGGFVLPWLFGLLVEGSGYTTAWITVGVISIATALITLLTASKPKASA